MKKHQDIGYITNFKFKIQKMSLWDPEAAGNAACFLRLDDLKMLEIRNTPFEGGKQVWIPNSETGHMKANIIGDGDKPNTTKVTIFKFKTILTIF